MSKPNGVEPQYLDDLYPIEANEEFVESLERGVLAGIQKGKELGKRGEVVVSPNIICGLCERIKSLRAENQGLKEAVERVKAVRNITKSNATHRPDPILRGAYSAVCDAIDEALQPKSDSKETI